MIKISDARGLLLVSAATVLLIAALQPAAISAEDDLALDELDGKTVTPKEFEAKAANAVDEAEKARSFAPLTESFKLFLRYDDLYVPPELMAKFTGALLKYGSPKEKEASVPRLLKCGQTEFSPAATAKFNLGIKLALVFGGASFEELSKLLGVKGVDLEWLLPALGKTGGAKAIPLIQEYRSDKSIIPVNNSMNIRAVPCAAILAAAYAGDETCLAKFLEFYEEDTLNLPKFAFWVAWGMREGINVKSSQELVAYCQTRISQAERLLDFLGRLYLPKLIQKANGGSLAIAGYLVSSMERAAPDQLRDYLDLLAHPAPAIKERLLDRILSSGDKSLKDKAVARLREMLASPAGADRLFAVRNLLSLEPGEGPRLLTQALSRENNKAVRVRIEDLMQNSRPDSNAK